MFDIGSVIAHFKADVTGFKNGVNEVKQQTASLQDKLADFGKRAAAIGAIGAAGFLVVKSGIEQTLDAANRYDRAMIGLSSIARSFKQDQDAAKKAAQELAKDGLMPVTDAANGLKNLLAAGFSLDQAIQLMNRFKDTAAFGRQGALDFGQAIVGATEGIKNGNSILVDNAGVTKNLSVMLEEAGFSAQDLSKATSDASIRQAIFNGILKESEPMLGDAGRLTDTAAGAQARMTAQVEIAQQAIGRQLQPVLLQLLQVLQPIVEKIAEFAERHPRVVQAIAVGLVVFTALFAIVGAIAGVIALVTFAFGSLAALITGAVIAAIAVLVGLAVAFRDKWSSIPEFFSGLWNKVIELFRNVGSRISNALGNVKDAITKPFKEAFDWISGTVGKVKDALGRLNPFKRESPSLVDNIRKGVSVIQTEFGKLNASAQGISPLPGAGNLATATANYGGIVINMDGAYIGTPEIAREFAEAVGDRLVDLMTNRMRI